MEQWQSRGTATQGRGSLGGTLVVVTTKQIKQTGALLSTLMYSTYDVLYEDTCLWRCISYVHHIFIITLAYTATMM